jgi:hypothetical protein
MEVTKSDEMETAMQLQDNFVALIEYRMVDPVLQVVVQRARFDMDDSAQWYDVRYDPELRPDRLWQKMPEEEIQRRIKFEMPRRKDDLIPFESEKIETLISFSIHAETIKDHLILRLRCNDQDFYLMRRLIAAKIPGPLSGQPDELIDYIVRSMPKWYGVKNNSPLVSSDQGGLKRLTFLLDKSFALHLPSCKAHAFEADGAGNIVFDRREIV